MRESEILRALGLRSTAHGIGKYPKRVTRALERRLQESPA